MLDLKTQTANTFNESIIPSPWKKKKTTFIGNRHVGESLVAVGQKKDARK
jgi:hypothetical protein